MDVVDVNDTNHEKPPKEILLGENGDKIFFHDEKAYDDFYPNGKSFDDVTGQGKAIRFTYTVRFHRDGVKHLAGASPNHSPRITSNCMMVHHHHVAWIYAPTVQLIEKDGCQLMVESVGPSLRQKGPTPAGGCGNNLPTRLTAPRAKIACAVVLSGGTLQPLEMVKEGENFKSKSPFPLSLLQNEDPDETTAAIQIDVTIPRDYFTLDSLMDTNLEKIAIMPEAQRLLDVVLKGEKAPGWDWIITVGEGQPKEFFVHGPVLAHSSPLLQEAISTHSSSLGKDAQILMVSHENRFILPQVHAEDMPVILSYFYLRSFEILPRYNTFHRVGRALCALLPPYALGNMFIYWQDAIVKQVEAMDRVDYKTTLPLLARHLISLYSSPYGAMPAAKKVLISTLADVWHMAETKIGSSELEKFINSQDVFQLEILKPARGSVDRFILAAGSVKKQYV